jgi:hypothetical protein
MTEQAPFCTYDIPQCGLELSYNLFNITENCNNKNAVKVQIHNLGEGSCGIAIQKGEDKTIYIDPAYTLQDLNIIIAHEFGHLYGYHHSAGDCDLMRFAVPMETCATFFFNGKEYDNTINYCE